MPRKIAEIRQRFQHRLIADDEEAPRLRILAALRAPACAENGMQNIIRHRLIAEFAYSAAVMNSVDHVHATSFTKAGACAPTILMRPQARLTPIVSASPRTDPSFFGSASGKNSAR